MLSSPHDVARLPASKARASSGENGRLRMIMGIKIDLVNLYLF